MSMLFNKNNICYICARSLLPVVLLCIVSFAQIPLKYSDIITSLEEKVPEPELVQQIEKRKVDFELTESDSVKLVLNGAGNKVLRAIIANRMIIKLPITFNGWQPFGDIAIAPWNKNLTVLCKGTSCGYPGLTTPKTFDIAKRRTLVVKIEGSEASTFTNQSKMLKVFASEKNETLHCITDSLLTPDDRDFVIKKDGEFRYRIPDWIITGGALKKLGLQFGPGQYKTFKVSAWFE